MPIRKILVPTDFSTYAELAVEEALEVADAFSASITLFHVYELPLPMSDGAYAFAAADTVRSIEASAQTSLAAARSDLLRHWRGSPERVGTTLAMGAPATRIVEEAQQGGYDLIVMGTHGRTGLSHMLIGSVAERVVRTSGCPVLTVPGKLAGISAHLGPPTEKFAPRGGADANLARPK
jgi:nucleotide-binding universal stress UspA family protein